MELRLLENIPFFRNSRHFLHQIASSSSQQILTMKMVLSTVFRKQFLNFTPKWLVADDSDFGVGLLFLPQHSNTVRCIPILGVGAFFPFRETKT
jgi:hypothetical protein